MVGSTPGQTFWGHWSPTKVVIFSQQMRNLCRFFDPNEAESDSHESRKYLSRNFVKVDPQRTNAAVAQGAVPERSELIGTEISGWRVGEIIGIGGTAVCFVVTAESTGTIAVMKVLRPQYVHNDDLKRRLRKEAEIARTVSHPGIVRMMDEGTLADGSPYVVFEKVSRESLATLLRREHRLPEEVAVWIMLRVLAIVNAAHMHGYIHRDIKPEHIVFDTVWIGNRDHVRIRLLDFGVCWAENSTTQEKQKEMGRVFGTPSYVSPEQASGEIDIDPRADVFTSGVVLFEMLAGRMPFVASSVTNLLRRIIKEEAPSLKAYAPDASDYVERIVGKAMSRERDGRFTDARTFARVLMPLLKDSKRAEETLLSYLSYEVDASMMVPSSKTTAATSFVAA